MFTVTKNREPTSVGESNFLGEITTFSGCVGLVTGAGSGIGRALAAALAAEGVRVAVTDVDLAAAEETALRITSDGGSATAMQLDVRSAEAWKEVAERTRKDLGDVDILCSNAGSMGCRLPLVSMPIDYLRWLFEVNVFASVRAIQAFVPGMKDRKRGWILFTGSMAGFASEPTVADYCASKHALLAIADALRMECEGAGITVSYLCPAGVPSNLKRSTQALIDETLARALPPASDIPDEVTLTSITNSGGMIAAETAAGIALDGLRAGQFVVPTHPASGSKGMRRLQQLDAALRALAGSPREST